MVIETMELVLEQTPWDPFFKELGTVLDCDQSSHKILSSALEGLYYRTKAIYDKHANAILAPVLRSS